MKSKWEMVVQDALSHDKSSRAVRVFKQSKGEVVGGFPFWWQRLVENCSGKVSPAQAFPVDRVHLGCRNVNLFEGFWGGECWCAGLPPGSSTAAEPGPNAGGPREGPAPRVKRGQGLGSLGAGRARRPVPRAGGPALPWGRSPAARPAGGR